PPPPPEQEVQPEPEMIEQTPIVEPEIKEEAKVEEPKDAPPEEASDAPPAEGPLGPGSDLPVGPGPSSYAPGPGGGGGGGGGSRWGAYSVMVTREIEAAIRANPKTRNAVMQVRVRLWADGTGRITRVQLVSSSGDAEIDALLRGSALAGLQLSSAPPSDMPMPIVTRITARRSG
ncbi:MAG: energy transducer TonB, partial [Aquamicrobium sp.]|nr:energy transducer TonB [Aquamicrobium sp.]